MAERVLVVDDEDDIRNGLADLIGSHPDFAVAGTAASAEAALDALAGTPVELVIADLILGSGPDGIQLTKALKARDPLLPVLILSGRVESLFAERALLAGASGYVMKDQAAEVLFGAMSTVLRGSVWVSDDIREQLLPRSIVPPALQARDGLQADVAAEVRRGNRTVGGLAQRLTQPLAAIERELAELQAQLGLPSLASLWLFLD